LHYINAIRMSSRIIDGKYQGAPEGTVMMRLLPNLLSYGRMMVNPRALAGAVHTKRTMIRIPTALRAHGYYAYFQSKLTM